VDGESSHSNIQLPRSVQKGGVTKKEEVQHAKKTRIPENSGKDRTLRSIKIVGKELLQKLRIWFTHAWLQVTHELERLNVEV